MQDQMATTDLNPAQKKLSSNFRQLLQHRFDADGALGFLGDATAGDIYVCGGALRRSLLGEQLSGDVDIMIPNGDERAMTALDDLGVPFVLNSHGHRRYRWNYLEIDIFQPQQFFGGFNDIDDALCFFDLKINAIAIHWGSNRILDPFQIVTETPIVDPGINWTHWEQALPLHVVILAIRLAKIFHEVRSLTISARDAQRLATLVVPRIRDCDWKDVLQRFPLGKEAFLSLFEMTVLRRIAESAHGTRA